MLIWYFAAARAATGIDEETLDAGEPSAWPGCWGGAPSRNEVAVRDTTIALGVDVVVGVLPPSAGG